MTGMPRSRIAVASALAALATGLLGCAFLFFRVSCVGDRVCAGQAAESLTSAGYRLEGPGSDVARMGTSLRSALAVNSCDEAGAAVEELRVRRRAPMDASLGILVDGAIRAYDGYCRVPLPDSDALCARRVACVLDRLEVQMAQASAAGEHRVSRAFRAASWALRHDSCEATTELARALGRLPLRKTGSESSLRASARTRAVDLALRYCSGVPARDLSPPPADATIVLERTACEGTCPTYEVTVGADGHAVYVGKGRFFAQGSVAFAVPAARVAVLFHSFEHQRFASLPREYPDDNRDGAGFALTLTQNGVSLTSSIVSQGLEDPALAYLADEVELLVDIPSNVGVGTEP